MEKVKSVYRDVLRKIGINSDDFDLKAHWKIIISIYVTLFILLIVGGWIFYSWVIQTESIPPKMKNVKPNITTEELNRAKTLSEERKDKLDRVIKEEPKVVDMK